MVPLACSELINNNETQLILSTGVQNWSVKSHDSVRLEAACERALEIGAHSYSSVNSILKNNLERRKPNKAADGPAIDHPNIRGPKYFN